MTLKCACGKAMKVPDTAAGKKVKCPACQSVITIPAAPVAVPAAPLGDELEIMGSDIPSAPPPMVSSSPGGAPAWTPDNPGVRPRDRGSEGGALNFLKAMIIPVLLLGGLAFVGWYFISRSKANEEAVKFNDALTVSELKLQRISKDFDAVVSGMIQGRQIEKTVLRDRYKSTLETLQLVENESRGLVAPATEAGGRLLASYREFLVGQREILVVNFGPVFKTLESGQLTAEALRKTFEEANDRGKAAATQRLQNFRAAQSEFAKNHGITLP